ncbi:type II secretion system F family protein [Microbacterium algeriense]|uniref:type II secretion system F family protein n=1 Tax=Microbacterium algeriense TaxID=2615184 RepID=UPI0022E45E9C|nr:type II secretion system F family protein [Microbacterium algeriense]
MNGVMAALATTIGILGLLVLVLGLLPAPVSQGPKPPSRLQLAFLKARGRFGKQRMMLAGAGFIGGVILWLFTGWIVWIVIVPLAAAGVPWLLSSGGEQRKLDRLEGLETWTRGLAGLTVAGSSLEQTIIASVNSSPDSIREEVTLLAARLNARWPTRSALRKFADDLADPTGDLIVAHLLLAERVRGAGLANALEDLAQSIAEEVGVRRKIEADRAKPRQAIRITTIATVVLIGMMPFVSQFMAPYKTPLGQLILAVLITLDVFMLLWLKKITAGKPTPRILADLSDAKGAL